MGRLRLKYRAVSFLRVSQLVSDAAVVRSGQSGFWTGAQTQYAMSSAQIMQVEVPNTVFGT